MTAILAERLFLPLSMFGGLRGQAAIKARLTVTPYHYDKKEPPPEPIPLYDASSRPGYLGVPIDWGLREYPDIEIDEQLTMGGHLRARRFPDPYHERASPGQDVFMADTIEALKTNYTVLGIAPTGSGKTVTALNAAGKLGRRTLVLLHLERLAHQWAEQAQLLLGLKESEIGWIQQDRCEYDKPFCVAIMHSVALRDYPPEFYQAFGTVIWDEVHRVGAPLFSQSLGLFPATYKLALTATPDRRDGTDKIYKAYFGPGYVKANAAALAAKVYVAEFGGKTRMFGRAHGAKVKALSLNKRRNRFLVDLIMRMYAKDRQILVIGDTIKHLQGLRDACIEAGMDEAATGLFVGEYYTGEKRDSYSTIKVAERHDVVAFIKGEDDEAPTCFEKYEKLKVLRRYDDDPQCYRVESLETKMQADVLIGEIKGVTAVDEKRKLTAEQLDDVKANAQVIFATYGMMKEGIDIPRLDAGIDVTPRADAAQVIGRIRRPMPGKKTPFWITIRDAGVPELEGYYWSRLRDYRKSNARVVENAESEMD